MSNPRGVLEWLYDRLSGALVTIDYAHHEVHAGDAYHAETSVLSGMADAATRIMAFKTRPDCDCVHVVVDFITLTGGRVEMIEDPTWDAESGSLINIQNRRRGSSNVSELLENKTLPAFGANGKIMIDPTSFANGEVIRTWEAYGDKGKFSGASRSRSEMLLKADATYGFKFTSTAAANAMLMTLDWYEHTPGV
ncbi:MAG: hypothetical protein GY841_20070 [FCB group bacterium]|nr:hypothetical protein [FCB group bacterium]